MGINKCSINGLDEVPSWADFFTELGKVVYDDSKRSSRSIKIIITLPTDSLELALLAAAGMGDTIFKNANKEQDYIEIFKQMPKGQTVYYMENGSRNICTFQGITYSEIFKQRAIKLKRKNDEITLIESKWSNIQLTDKKEYKVARKVKGDGISSPFLREVYDNNLLEKVMLIENQSFYIVGNIKEIEYVCLEENFTYNYNKKGRLYDFVRADKLCATHDYTHAIITSKRRDDRIELEVNRESPVIFTDASSYINKKEMFNSNPSLIFMSRLDNEFNLENIIMDLTRIFKEHQYDEMTQEIVDFISQKAKIPSGIEIIAWRE